MIGGFDTVTKGLLKGLEDVEVGGRVETIQTTAFLRTAKIKKESWRLEETWYHSNSCERPSANADVKNFQRINYNNQRIRKSMTMLKSLHPRDDVDKLYISRKEGGRGLASIEDSVDASIQRLEDYIEKPK